MSIVYRARYSLITLAKVFPFILCGLVLFSYLECLFALVNQSFATYQEFIILYTPFSWWVAMQFEYGLYAILLSIVLAYSAETCIYNKLAIVYLVINLVEKHYFESIELYEEEILTIVVANIIVSGFLTFKGVSIFLKSI